MINAVEYLHQRIAVRPWLHVIEQIQLRDAVRTEIIEHYPRFCVAVAIEPDPVQRPDRSRDNVPGVTGRGVQFFRGHVTVIRLINRKRGCLDEGADMPAVLSLTAQLFRRALGILADGLAHFFVGGDPLFARKGEVVNPLKTVPFVQTLYFINGDDADQLAWMKRQVPETLMSKIILVRGSIPDTSAALDSRIYFDQNGVLSKRFGLTAVPARITPAPSGERLNIETFPPVPHT